MASLKRPVTDIMNDTMLPKKSKTVYEKAWQDFKTYVGDKSPEEEDFLQYFDYLHTERNLKSSTLWTTYSQLNTKYQIECNKKLQDYPRIQQLLKRYEDGYVRKVASVLTKEELDRFLKEADDEPYLLVRKTVAVLAVCGGLRCQEVRDIRRMDVKKVENRYEVRLVRRKQRGEEKSSLFIVPDGIMADILGRYLNKTNAKLQMKLNGESPLILGCPKNRNKDEHAFVNQPMGKNYLYNIGKDIARYLNLENPDTYTGHCFRRSSATMAADAGITAPELQRHFQWSSSKTAQRYIEESSVGANKVANIFQVR